MRKIMCIAFLLVAIPVSLYGARLQYALPPGLSKAYLLSAGTPAMLEHEKARAKAKLEKLKGEFRIDTLEAGSKQGSGDVKRAKQAYADRIEALRKAYLSRLNLQLTSVNADINLASSAMADVTYFYTARNSSDKVITDITYRPLINGKPLGTTSTLVLEFMDMSTLTSGLAPGETMTNQGHDPEKFSFFLGEIPQAEVKELKKDFGRKFTIDVIDMHFADRKGYKGQFKPQTFEESFAGQLGPLENAIRQAEARARELSESDRKALKEFTAQKDRLVAEENKTLVGLKRSAVRYTGTIDKKGRHIFEDVAPGTYFLYASTPDGRAVFEQVKVGEERKQKKTFTGMKKDPFVP
ncbi:MAG TPA: hypothetical protein PK213_12640 [Deltaproteobacteria bacterium]|nr:hypothetical protein [Deltaproteobacteria bacterium]